MDRESEPSSSIYHGYNIRRVLLRSSSDKTKPGLKNGVEGLSKTKNVRAEKRVIYHILSLFSDWENQETCMNMVDVQVASAGRRIWRSNHVLF